MPLKLPVPPAIVAGIGTDSPGPSSTRESGTISPTTTIVPFSLISNIDFPKIQEIPLWN